MAPTFMRPRPWASISITSGCSKCSGKGRLIRAFYYTALIEDQEYSPIRPLVDWLDYNGYTDGHQADQGIHRRARPPQDQGQYGYRARHRRDGDGASISIISCCSRATAISAAGRGGAAQGRARAGSRPMRSRRRWSPTNCAARPTNSSNLPVQLATKIGRDPGERQERRSATRSAVRHPPYRQL